MIDQKLLMALEDILGRENVRVDEPMSHHTTFKIGGNADVFITPEKVEQVEEVVRLLAQENHPFYVIGNGSNLLVSDEGYRGVIIQLFDKFNRYEFLHDSCNSAADKNNQVYVKVQSGIMLGRLGKEMAGYSLAGFEFATGIPGTLGGAVTMNAGAYGGEMKDVLIKATVLDRSGNLLEFTKEELELGYRTSVISQKGYIVLEVVIALKPGNKQEIMDTIKDLAARRMEKQPLEYPSAGSTFKRPEGYFAGKLISDAGLKGFQVGGAQVSQKHAGFVINAKNATAADVIGLTEEVSNIVYERYGVKLELEVKKLGF
jgi:UDP-N-acetylmuramate dehydrogenase